MAVKKTTKKTNFLRDERGLLSPDKIDYKFNEDGTVDWKSMIPLEHIVFNEEWFEKNGINVPEAKNLSEVEDPSQYDDKQLLILLAGTKEVAKMRGIKKVKKTVQHIDSSHVSVSTEITFVGNFETGGEELVYEEVANANYQNTNNHFVSYLETIASNRSFTRAVRNALRIDILGSDEVSSRTYASTNSEASAKVDVHSALAEACAKYEANINGQLFKLDSFEKFKAFMTSNEKAVKNYPQAAGWQDWSDIPLTNIWTILKGIGEKIN